MIVHNRIPRAVSAVVLCVLGLLALQFVFGPLKSIKRPAIFQAQPPAASSLKSHIDDEESKYRVALQDRDNLIRKWGPTAEDIIPFPRNGALFTLWDFFIPSFRCPHRVERVGTLGDGGKWTCGVNRYANQRAPCVIYSFGLNGESSFEADFLKRAPHCEIWGYDFSVHSFGPEIENDPALKARAHFFPYAIGGEDIPEGDPPTFTLQTLMQQNGHSFIDLLKIDVEESEFDSLSTFVDHFVPSQAGSDATVPVGQMQLEIHAWGPHATFPTFKRWWENLERAGLRPFWTEPNLVYLQIMRGSLPDLAEYSFMNIRARSTLTDDSY
ncbi:methyltransferase domain-containing protein [Irpex rosettiformis]|uniref:Methyltransferase domain-containing protein n=1 Tax=Irpex rosettiformis TaxID=378272 RepID=A0ACB8U1F4_9APHY|nr:methyltransferase domain-containing protein [Irpex rosettiformis]